MNRILGIPRDSEGLPGKFLDIKASPMELVMTQEYEKISALPSIMDVLQNQSITGQTV